MQSEPQSPNPADEMRAPAEWNRPPPKAKPNETSFESSATLTRPALYIVGTYLSIGTLLFSALEGWGLSTSIYFCVITLTTVGYGDVVPKTAGGKLLCVLYIFLGVTLVSASLGAILGKAHAALAGAPHTSVRATQQRHRSQATSAACSMLGIVLLGAVLAAAVEGWGPVDSLYFAMVTCSSVGFGDLSPSDDARPGHLLFVLPAVGVFALQAARLVRVVMEIEVEREVAAFVKKGVSPEMIAEIDVDGGGSVDRNEFLEYMLVKTGKVEEQDLESVRQLFASLDRDGSGTIDEADMLAATSAKGGRGRVSGAVAASSDGHVSDPSDVSEVGSETSLLPGKTRPRPVWRAQLSKMLAALAAFAPAQAAAAVAAVSEVRAALASFTQVKFVDASLAAVALASSIGLLHALDVWAALQPLRFFSPPMLSSGILLFAGPAPPPASNFVVGTAGAFLMGLSLHQLSAAADSVGAQCLAAGLLLFYFKASGSFFVPTVGLAAHLATSGHGGRAIKDPLSYLLAPWGLGHMLLYALASAASYCRQRVRLALLPDWKTALLGGAGAGAEIRKKRLHDIFDRFDTSSARQPAAEPEPGPHPHPHPHPHSHSHAHSHLHPSPPPHTCACTRIRRRLPRCDRAQPRTQIRYGRGGDPR